MAEVKADIAHISIPEKVDVGKARVEALTGNTEVLQMLVLSTKKLKPNEN